MTDEDFNKINIKIGAQLKEYRMSKNITQSIIAAECNTTKSSISRVEKGHKSADIDILQAYSKVLDIPLSTLVKIEDLEVAPELNLVTCLLSMSYRSRRIAYRIIYDIWDMDLGVKNKSSYEMTEHSNAIFSMDEKIQSPTTVANAPLGQNPQIKTTEQPNDPKVQNSQIKINEQMSAPQIQNPQIKIYEQSTQETKAENPNLCYIPGATLRGMLRSEAAKNGLHPADVLLEKDLKLMRKKKHITDSENALEEGEE